MTSPNGSPLHPVSKEDDLCDTICKLIRDSDTTAVPVVDIVQSASTGTEETGDEDANDVNDTENKLNEDELDDLVEEQLVLNKIKEFQTTRRNLGINRRPVKGIDASLIHEHDNTASQEESNDDDDSLLNFTCHTSGKDDRERYKTDLNRISKALTANIVMQSELNKLELFLVEKLKVNHMKQANAKEEIRQLAQNSEKVGNESRPRTWYRKYGIPYFKDQKYFPSGPNLDVKKMKSSGQVLTIHFNNSKMWRLKEKMLLEEGVRQLLIKDSTATLTEEVDQLLRSDKDKTEIKQKLSVIKPKIEAVKNNSLINLFNKGVSEREFDWATISYDYVRVHSACECQRMWHLYVKPSVNKARWSPKEDKMLLELVDKYKKQNWDVIANELGTWRSGYQCFVNYQTRLNKEMRKIGKWTKEEDERLAILISKCKVGSYIPWTKIAYYFEGRSLTQIYSRWNCSLNPELKKGRFSRHEDRMIASFVRQFGENFSKISTLIKDRSSVQLRERYSRAIPAKFRNVGRWSLDEDRLLMALVKTHGVSNWSSVSSQFVTRTRTQVRQRFVNIQKILSENPNLELEDFHRGPSAQLQSTVPHMSTDVNPHKDKRLADLVEEHHFEEAIMKKKNQQLAFRIKKGRRKITKRNVIDTKLLNYFRESYTNENLMLKTHYVKPDVEKALNAMAVFFQFLHVHITLPQPDSTVYKRLPSTLRNIVFKMRDLYTTWGCTCLDRDVPAHSYFCRCKKQTLIDCYPVNSKSTLVDESDYILSLITDHMKPIEAVGTVCKCSSEINRHFIPYYLPPNIITSIGFRSALLMKDKIALWLAINRKQIGGYFSNSDVELRCNGLKGFTGYFSEDNSSSDEEAVSRKQSLESPRSTPTRNVPSCSYTVSTISQPNAISVKEEPEHMLFGDLPPTLEEPRVERRESPKRSRLTPQEAISLWKERLMAILGWPIVLSNQPPHFTIKEEDVIDSAPENDGEEVSTEHMSVAENALLKSDTRMKQRARKGRRRKFSEVSDDSNADIGNKKILRGEYSSCNRLCNDDCDTQLVDDSQPISEEKCLEKELPQNDSGHSSVNIADDVPTLAVPKVFRCYSRKKTNSK